MELFAGSLSYLLTAGGNAEVWVDFGCAGLHRGDVCQPFGTLAQASAGVAAGGTLRLVPGRTGERTTIGAGKAMRLVAPIGGVTIGS